MNWGYSFMLISKTNVSFLECEDVSSSNVFSLHRPAVLFVMQRTLVSFRMKSGVVSLKQTQAHFLASVALFQIFRLLRPGLCLTFISSQMMDLASFACNGYDGLFHLSSRRTQRVELWIWPQNSIQLLSVHLKYTAVLLDSTADFTFRPLSIHRSPLQTVTNVFCFF